jgi:hypothetical protein
MATTPDRRHLWWLGAVAIAAATAVAGVAKPQAAPALATATAIALAALGAIHAASRLFARVDPAPRSDFAPAAYRPPPQTLPAHIARMLPDHVAGEHNLTSGARAGVITVAGERLWAHHGLDLRNDRDHAAIERLAGEQLWSIIGPDARDAHGYVRSRRAVKYGELDRILDQLETM